MVNLKKKEPIVQSESPIALFGGGEIGPGDVNLALDRVELTVAADGGAAHLLDSGHIPDAVLGDFDSLDPSQMARIPADRLFPIWEQNSTDFDKALRNIMAPLVLGVGFLGARVDHQLAVFNTLVRRVEKPCILLGQQEIAFHAPPEFELELTPGSIVSLFPFRQVTGRSKGLEWPIDDLVFEPDGQIGTSNRSVADIRLEMGGPGMLVMLPRATLDQVMQAFLSGQTGRWPARVE